MQNPFEHPLFIYAKYPRHRGKLNEFDAKGEKGNPSCGDEVIYYVKVEDGRVVDVSFEGHGCSVSQASADILAEWAIGKDIKEILSLNEEIFLNDIIGGVIPTRIRCALVSLSAMKEALKKVS